MHKPPCINTPPEYIPKTTIESLENEVDENSKWLKKYDSLKKSKYYAEKSKTCLLYRRSTEEH